jgi:hypothetical protein
MRSAVIFFVLLLWPLSLPSAASAAPLSLYGPFDQKHYGVRSEPASSPAYGRSLGLREGPLPRSGNLPVQRTGRSALKAASVGGLFHRPLPEKHAKGMHAIHTLVGG